MFFQKIYSINIVLTFLKEVITEFLLKKLKYYLQDFYVTLGEINWIGCGEIDAGIILFKM